MLFHLSRCVLSPSRIARVHDGLGAAATLLLGLGGALEVGALLLLLTQLLFVAGELVHSYQFNLGEGTTVRAEWNVSIGLLFLLFGESVALGSRCRRQSRHALVLLGVAAQALINRLQIFLGL